ncbi:MAG: PKD domain-containing protein [Spirochaetes bacterium]|nr:PKD domain-containing protein [Spirochaetota bacterium]
MVKYLSNYRKNIFNFLILFLATLAILFFNSVAYSQMYYVDGNMTNDSGDGTSWATAKKYISSGISLMSSGGGDILTVADGVYTGSANRITDVPSGSAGNYNVVQAETDFGVEILDTVVETHVSIDNDYIKIQGFKLNSSTPANRLTVSGDYVKIIRCSADGGTTGATWAFHTTGLYTLFEECYVYGGPLRYAFGARDTAEYTVVRRCVVRWDWSAGDYPQAAFASYDVSHIAFQNCIAIDATSNTESTTTYTGYKSFFTPNGATDVRIQGSISLNVEGTHFWIEDNPIIDVLLNNNIGWGSKEDNSGGYASYALYRRYDTDGSMSVSNMTFGEAETPNATNQNIVTGSSSVGTISLKNSIFYSLTAGSGYYAFEGSRYGTHDYNDFYGNSPSNSDDSLGSNSLIVDPTSNGLLYLPRIESGSILKTAGENGGRIGAEIMYKIGVSGSLWGEPGWDTVTTEPLWPFPNESQMKVDMGSFYKASGEAYPGSPIMVGARGFATGNSIDGSPQTLTKYIWEYLGNRIPDDVYAESESNSSNVRPTSSINIASSSGTVPFLVNFDGTGNDADGQIVSYLWQFGDGTTSSQEDPSHNYAAVGNYTVSLVTIDNYGASSIPATVSITVTPGPDAETGNNYFVDSASGLDSSLGTQVYPWKTIQHAIDQVSEGTIYVMNTETPYSPIKFVGKSNLKIKGLNGIPEIRGTQYDDGRQVAVVITESSNITLDSLDINANTSSATLNNLGVRMYGGVNHITIKNCELRNAGERNLMTSSNSNYLTLENNNIHDSLGGHCVYFSNGGNDYVVRDNVFENCNSAGMQFNGDGKYMSSILVENNIFLKNAKGLNTIGSDTAAEALALVEVNGAIIKNNIFYDNDNKGVDVYSDSSPSYNVKIFNNTFYVHSDTGRPAIQVKENSSHDVFVTNNLVVNQEVESVDYATNMISRDNEDDIFVSSDPLSTNDLMLKSGSSAIDQGVNLSSENVLTDILNRQRPQGEGYDFGAYEYSDAMTIMPPNSLQIIIQ